MDAKRREELERHFVRREWDRWLMDELLENVSLSAAKAERERCALLHDSIDPGCTCQPEGCGAMRAIIQYRDLIRARGE